MFNISFFELSFLAEACIPVGVEERRQKIEELGTDWYTIPGYDGFYVINKKGDVLSLPRTIQRSNGTCQKIYGKLLTPCTDKKGYLVLRLSKNDRAKSYKVHQLVAMSFLNHTPAGNTLVVDHIDNNKLNNCLSNLQIIEHSKNTRKESKGFTSAFRGVFFSKEKSRWLAHIIHEGKRYYLGSFKEEKEASNAYEHALKCIENNDIKNIKNYGKKV